MNEFRDLANRLVIAYSGSRRLEEFRSPGLAAKAEQLARDEPERYGAIAAALMDGVSAQAIAKANKVPVPFVRFIRQMHPELVLISRSQLIAHLEEASIAMAQRLMDETRDLSVNKLPGALATTLDKLALLTGGVTQRTEHVSAPRPEDLKKMFDQLPKC